MENKMAKGLVVGFIAGGVVGAVLALLNAPKSGKELRQDIKNKSDSLVENADEYLTSALNKAEDMIHDGKKQSGSTMKKARKRAETLMNDVERIIDDTM